MAISAKTRVCAVIGDPIEHSLSPAIQNAAFNALKLDFIYEAFRVKASDIREALDGMRALGIVGLNVTMPHKHTVIRYLDTVDTTTRYIGAVNTIKNENGKLSGFNTDGIGALKALMENGIDPKNKKILLLGAGGAARAIAYTLAKEASELVILNRKSELSSNFVLELAHNLGCTNISAGALEPEFIKHHLKDASILINATSIGMKSNRRKIIVKPEWLRPQLSGIDIVYSPIETRLIKDANKSKVKFLSGVEMLIYQGAASFEIWTGKQAPVHVMRKAALEQLSRM